jgi:hypothetical protein
LISLGIAYLHSGGILVGVNNTTLQVRKVVNEDYCVKFQIRSKKDGFEWLLIPVYGAAQESNKADFLAKLVRTCENEKLPLLVGGIPGHLLRPGRTKEKSNTGNGGPGPADCRA